MSDTTGKTLATPGVVYTDGLGVLGCGTAVTPGYRNDAGKPLFSLVPSDALEGVAAVLEYGARKYAERNWEKGMSWSRCFNSGMRHAWKWWRGQDLDPESGLPHIDHAVCNFLMLAAYAKRADMARHDDREHLGKRDARALGAT